MKRKELLSFIFLYLVPVAVASFGAVYIVLMAASLRAQPGSAMTSLSIWITFIFWIALILVTSRLNRMYFLCDFAGFDVPEPVADRLKFYAEMHGKKFIDEGSASDEYALSPAQHKIMLGIIKKVEAKNAVVTAINIALVVLSFNVVVQWKSAPTLAQWAIISALGVFVALIVGRFDGVAHIAQRRTCKDLRQDRPGRTMQLTLLRDMLQKEAVFAHAVIWLSGALLGSSTLVVIAWALEN